MNWNDLRYVLTVARAGTLAAAARRLGVDQTTVARRLARADAALGGRLFDRVDGALRPTPTGVAAIDRAAQIEQQIQALESGERLADAEQAGVVRLTTVPILANRLLIPALPAFQAEHPRIRIELIAEPRNVSFTRREADIALRLSRPERAGSTLARRIGRLDYAAYGLRGAGDDRLPWIGYEDSLSHLPHARWIAAAAARDGRAMLAVNDAESAVQAIYAGLGRCLLPCCVADRDPRLKRLGRTRTVLSRELWLLVHRDLRPLPRIAAVLDWLQRLSGPQRAGARIS